MTSDNLPLFAWAGGITAALIIASLALYFVPRWWRDRNRRLDQLIIDRCWDCGGPYHFPCPETTEWRRQ